MPRVIRQIEEKAAEKVQELYERYPFEKYGDPVIRRKLRRAGLQENRLEYAECYDAAMLAYIYSIHRCALCGYEHVEYYIRKLVNLAFVWGVNMCGEERRICETQHLREVRLEAEKRPDRW